MSLRLNDLKNSKAARGAKATPASGVAAASDSLKTKRTKLASKTARPWGSSEAPVRAAKSRRRLATDASMNDEWVSLHDEPLFWLDLQSDSRLACLHDRLAAAEERIQHIVCAPLKTLNGLLRGQKYI